MIYPSFEHEIVPFLMLLLLADRSFNLGIVEAFLSLMCTHCRAVFTWNGWTYIEDMRGHSSPLLRICAHTCVLLWVPSSCAFSILTALRASLNNNAASANKDSPLLWDVNYCWAKTIYVVLVASYLRKLLSTTALCVYLACVQLIRPPALLILFAKVSFACSTITLK